MSLDRTRSNGRWPGGNISVGGDIGQELTVALSREAVVILGDPLLATAGDQDPVPSWVDDVVVGDDDAVVDEAGARVIERDRAMVRPGPPGIGECVAGDADVVDGLGVPLGLGRDVDAGAVGGAADDVVV